MLIAARLPQLIYAHRPVCGLLAQGCTLLLLVRLPQPASLSATLGTPQHPARSAFQPISSPCPSFPARSQQAASPSSSSGEEGSSGWGAYVLQARLEVVEHDR